MNSNLKIWIMLQNSRLHWKIIYNRHTRMRERMRIWPILKNNVNNVESVVHFQQLWYGHSCVISQQLNEILRPIWCWREVTDGFESGITRLVSSDSCFSAWLSCSHPIWPSNRTTGTSQDTSHGCRCRSCMPGRTAVSTDQNKQRIASGRCGHSRLDLHRSTPSSRWMKPRSRCRRVST